MSSSQYHLTSQYYDICIRRARSSCAVCYYPVITPTLSSYGVSGGSPAPGTTNNQAIGSVCTGVTVISATAADQKGYGDYLDIANAQDPAATGAGAAAESGAGVSSPPAGSASMGSSAGASAALSRLEKNYPEC